MPDPMQNLQQCECGSDKLFIEQHWQRDGFKVVCTDCDRQGHYRTSPKSAIISWNAKHGQAEDRESSLQEHLKTPIKKGFGSHVTGFREPEDGTAIRFQWKGQWFRAAIKSNGDIIVERSVDGQFLKTDETTRVMEIFLNYVQDHG